MTYPIQNTNDGFTIIELLIAIAIMSIIIGSMFSFSIAQRKYFSVQEEISEMTQNTRAAMDMIGGELAMAGYRPSDAIPVFSGIPYSASQLQIFAEFNGDGDRDDPNENITYTYDTSNKRILRDSGGGNQPFSENVQSFIFEYLDAQGNPTTTTANIRQIRLTITGRTGKPDHLYATNSGYRTYTLTSLITPRNLAYW
jgi:prepilin-type N-terminal cleavage/methylation domain-containing protein